MLYIAVAYYSLAPLCSSRTPDRSHELPVHLAIADETAGYTSSHAAVLFTILSFCLFLCGNLKLTAHARRRQSRRQLETALGRRKKQTDYASLQPQRRAVRTVAFDSVARSALLSGFALSITHSGTHSGCATHMGVTQVEPNNSLPSQCVYT